MACLAAIDKDYFKEHGYVVVREALVPQTIDAALDVIWDKVEADRNDRDSWIGKGYHAFDIGETEALTKTIYCEPVFAMAEEMVGKGALRTEGGGNAPPKFPSPRE